MLIQEGLLDFLGNLFGKLVDFLFGDTEEAASQAKSTVTSSANDRVVKAAEKADLGDEVKSVDDLDMKDEKHQKVFYAALAPVVVDLSKEAFEKLKTTEAVKDWTPADESEEATKKWQEENGEAAGGLYGALGTMTGLLQFFGEKGISSAAEASEAGVAAAKDSPGAAAQWVAEAGPKALAGIFEFAKTAGIDGAEDAIAATSEVATAGKAVAEKIAASGSEQAEEAKETQKESLELRKLINGLVLQERTRNI